MSLSCFAYSYEMMIIGRFSVGFACGRLIIAAVWDTVDYWYSRCTTHTAPEQNLGLKKIAIKTESAAMWRMNIRSF